MNLAQCLFIPAATFTGRATRLLGVISWDKAHEEIAPAPPPGWVPQAPRVRHHEAPDLSQYAAQSIRELHRKIVALLERERRSLTIDDLDGMLHHHYGKKKIMSAACYLAALGVVERHEGPGRKCSYGSKPEAL